MSEPTDHGIWSADEADLLDPSDVLVENINPASAHLVETKMNTHFENQKLHASCDDLSHSRENKFVKTQSCQSLQRSEKNEQVKTYIEHDTESPNATKHSEDHAAVPSKEEYLEEINQMLRKELEEKNTILTQLQQNYEHLLMKYAEAQNKIDNLRLEACEQLKPKTCKFSAKESAKTNRPATLPITTANHDNDNLKAVTPTDSEGVSSVMTSMSGHSKILNNLEEPCAALIVKDTHLKSNVLNAVLNHVNDPLDKVRSWQNSLTPLDMIERPEDAAIFEPVTPSTAYNDIVSQIDSRLGGGKNYSRPPIYPKKQCADRRKNENLLDTRRKKPPIFRSVSLPISESPLSIRKNIPLLDLGSFSNVTTTPEHSPSFTSLNDKEEKCASYHICDNCHVCGESVTKSSSSFNRSKKRSPLLRSISLNSEAIMSPNRCSYASSPTAENFETFANHLRARSQVTLKALAAHVKNTS